MSNSYAQYVNNTYLICEKKLPAAKPDEAEKSGARVLPSDSALLRPLVPSVVLYSQPCKRQSPFPATIIYQAAGDPCLGEKRLF